MRMKNKENQLVLEVKVTETDIFEEFLNTVTDIMADERIEKDIREEYLDKLSDIVERYEFGERKEIKFYADNKVEKTITIKR